MESSDSLEVIKNERLNKKAKLESLGLSAYPSDVHRDHTIAQVLHSFDILSSQNTTIILAGRIMSLREHGGSVFFHLYDGTATMQVYIKKDEIGEDAFTLFHDSADRSDIVEVSGTLFVTKRGEKTLLVASWRMLAKSLMPVPDAWYGLKDEDERYRKRYLDILLDQITTDRIRKRSTFWNAIRTFLLDRDFIEVETPVFENTPGGADARPFVTHHNALDMDVYLRISAGELWQKKLMVAGLPRTFEIGRIFRNEGMSAEHLQDYTQLEFYEAYSDYQKGMQLIKELYIHIAQKVFDTTTFTIGSFTIDLESEWRIYDYCHIIQEQYGFDPRDASQVDAVRALKASGASYDEATINLERAVDMLWKKCRKQLSGPGFLVNVPVYLEPLAKRSSNDPRVVERFQVILAGSEMGKGFSELNDPVDQRERFHHQEELRAQGDDEAQMNDTEFVEALEYGMPPTFGFGMSERLFAFLCNVSVREGQIFPLMRPRGNEIS